MGRTATLRRIAVALLLVLLVLPAPTSAAGVAHEGTVTGGSTSSALVSTLASVPGVSGELYLAAVSTRANVAVQSVNGLGLAWARVAAQCAGRNGTRVEVWRAIGTTSGAGAVTATLAAVPMNAVIAVSRYSGVDVAAPVGAAVSANSLGAGGACSGGAETATYAVSLTTGADAATVYSVAAMRTRTHTPGAGYTERVEVVQGSSGAKASEAVQDRSVPTAGVTSVAGKFSGNVDWAVAAVEIRPSAPAPVNRPPVAENGSITTREDTAAAVTLAASDPDGNQLTYRIVDHPDNGSLTGTAPTLTYTPAAGFIGSDGFAFVVNDGTDNSNVATVSVTVTDAPHTPSLWLSAAELAALPTSGLAWDKMKAAADGNLGTPTVYGFTSNHDVRTLAVALVYARTGQTAYRQKAAEAIRAVIGTESQEGTQAIMVARNLASYVISADLIGLSEHDAALDATFRAWISALRTHPFPDGSLVREHERRANNHGTMPGASRAAVAAYLDDSADLARTAQVFKGWLGNRSAYAGFSYTEFSWQADPVAPVAINPAGTFKDGHPIGGALPEEMRRGCAFQWPPCLTGYPWGGLQGAMVQAKILAGQGYDVWNWQDQALLRAVTYLDALDRQFGGWWAAKDDTWVPWLVNDVYGTTFRTSPAGIGKNMGWTDWMYG